MRAVRTGGTGCPRGPTHCTYADGLRVPASGVPYVPLRTVAPQVTRTTPVSELRQHAADHLGVPVERVRLRHGHSQYCNHRRKSHGKMACLSSACASRPGQVAALGLTCMEPHVVCERLRHSPPQARVGCAARWLEDGRGGRDVSSGLGSGPGD